MMVKPTTVTLPQGVTQTRPELAEMPENLRRVMSEFNVREIESGFPEFRSEDTLRVLQDGRVYRLPDWTNLFIITLPEHVNRDTVIARLERLPWVEYAEKNQLAQPRSEVIPTNQQYFNQQWGLKNQQYPGQDIRATFAWSITKGNTNEKLGIIDSGVKSNHIDLSGKVSGPAAFTWNTTNAHGTQVAGIAAARGDNTGGGIAGVDWRAQIYAGQIGSTTQTAQAINAAVNAGVRVINNSWGYAESSTTLTNSLRSAYEAGVLLVHANPYQSGSPDQTSNYPNNIGPWILNVGAISITGNPPSWTGHRSFTDVGAPGVSIISTSSNSTTSYDTVDGTSFAAPHVAGTATLMRAVKPELRNYDIEHIIKRTAKNYPTHNAQIGYGMINAHEALKRLSSPYTISHGQASFNKFCNDQLRQFTASPLPELAAGHYRVDCYELTANASYSYQDVPWAWLSVTDKGYSYANPNNAQRWMQESITSTSLNIKTVFYYIRSTSSGQQVNKWAPFDPTVFRNNTLGRYEFTINGKGTYIPPIAISISGPGPVYTSGNYTWTASASGGTGSYTYTWYRRIEHHTLDCIYETNWSQVGTGTSYSSYVHNGEYDFVVRVDVQSGNQNASAQRKVYPMNNGNIVCPTSGDELLAMEIEAFALPTEFAIHDNYPNPFNPSTTIRYEIPEASRVSLVVYDIMGREVLRLVDDVIEPGYYTVKWEGRNSSGNPVSSGIYIYRFTARPLSVESTAEGLHYVKKMLFTK
jgi:thermitase